MEQTLQPLSSRRNTPGFARRASLIPGVLCLALTACSTGPDLSRAGPPPPKMTQSSVADVQVFREETSIRMTNTTAKPLPKGRMWINNWYSREFDGLAVGQSVEIDLSDFRDRYGEAFKAGGFFAAYKPDTLVLAQIHAGDELIGLIVVGERTY